MSRTQVQVNAAVDAGELVATIRRMIVEAADEAHAAFGQYEGYWSGEEWQLGMITRATRTRLGLAFDAGDVVLYKLTTAQEMVQGSDGAFVTAYSMRNGVNTRVAHADVSKLATTFRAPGGLVHMNGA